MTDLRQDFLNGMSCVAATVNVVATDGPAGRAGVTVSAMSSVSADTEKPVLLVCVNDQSACAAPIIENGVFTVNILRDDQSFVSDTFAGRYGDKGEDKFSCGEWESGTTGAPILRGALACFDCKIIDDRMVGQHHVLFGEVQDARIAERGRALIYANRSYSTALSLPPARGGQADDARERICVACVSSFAALHMPALLLRLRNSHADLHIDVIEGDQAQVAHLVETGEAHFGLLYDRDIPDILSAEKLRPQAPHALLSGEDPRAMKSDISLVELADEPLILLDQPLSRDYVRDLFMAVDQDPNIVMQPSSFEMVRSLVGNGLGYAVLVTQPEGDVSYDGKRLVRLPLTEDLPPISITLAWHRKHEPSGAQAAFAAECRAYFQSV